MNAPALLRAQQLQRMQDMVQAQRQVSQASQASQQVPQPQRRVQFGGANGVANMQSLLTQQLEFAQRMIEINMKMQEELDAGIGDHVGSSTTSMSRSKEVEVEVVSPRKRPLIKAIRAQAARREDDDGDTNSETEEEREEEDELDSIIESTQQDNPDKALKKILNKQEYKVENLYKKHSCWTAIATNQLFQNAIFVFITLNALWIGITTDNAKADNLLDCPWWIIVGENIFCVVFTFEMIVRWNAFRKKCDALRDFWFMFDGSLTLLMFWSTWCEPIILCYIDMERNTPGGATVLRIFRMTRLVRVTRVGRISRFLREVPELAILSKALVYALRSVSATVCLLFVTIYVFAIFFTQMLADNAKFKDWFATVPMSWNTLLLSGILPDQASIINRVGSQGFFYYVIILVYFFIAALAVSNMLIGVVCDVIHKIADEKRQEMAREALELSIKEVICGMDKDSNLKISKDEFTQLLFDQRATRALQSYGIDLVALARNAEHLYHGGVELSFEQLLEFILAFRDPQMCNFLQQHLEMKAFVRERLSELVAEGAISARAHHQMERKMSAVSASSPTNA